jgi:hypothetical protein
MTTVHTTTVPLTALGDELYVELVPGRHLGPRTVSFPALGAFRCAGSPPRSPPG